MQDTQKQKVHTGTECSRWFKMYLEWSIKSKKAGEVSSSYFVQILFQSKLNHKKHLQDTSITCTLSSQTENQTQLHYPLW